MKKAGEYSRKGIPSLAITSVLAACLLTACSKDPQPQAAPEETASAPANPDHPTGLVKNPVKHGHVADVTQWMDQAGTKTPQQIAAEERAAKEAKEKAEKAALEAKKAQEAKAAPAPAKPAIRETVTPVTPAPQAAAPAPVQAAPAPVQVAAAAPAPKPAAAEPEKSNVLKLVSNPAPKYPTAAARAGITEGAVSARLHIEPDGRVSQVEILKARPTKVFDKEVIAAASQWKYAPIAKGQTIVTEFNFKYDN
ncbi:energy transducer TonB [Undibacterium squillarum]|uniref:TonB C-terminal domain-containing protein n=1 Tax=Undibacterium squillarum TaxID=1131567 RepID=A0ABQ2Y2W9_9BURK|nr:energy transducer TonB [Undibacterium squillarum]GGX53611.1 hypothetical protein GCM10010946_35330 [Undibacterium squillarum]